MAAHSDRSRPRRVDLTLRALLGEFLDHGGLVSRASFGIDPDDLPGTLARGYERVTDPSAPYQQLESDTHILHRGRALPLTVKPFYLRERYLTTSFALWHGAPLPEVLRWLAAHRSAPNLELFQFAGANRGAVVANGAWGLHFTRRGRCYRLVALEGSASLGADDPDLPNGFDEGAWVRNLMTPCDIAQLRALAAQASDRDAALAAVAEIAAYLP